MTTPVTVLRKLEVRAPVERIWPLVADTDRINRAIGLPAVSYEPSPDNPLLRRVKARLFGLLPTAWEEPPFEWVEPQYYAVRRTYLGGPLREMRFGVRLSPKEGRTHLEIFAEILPRFPLTGSVLEGVVGRSLDGIAALCRGFEDSVWEAERARFCRAPGKVSINRRRLEEALRGLAGRADPRILERLSRHLQDAADEEVVRMRPYELADRWGQDRLAVLRACLAAARQGLLDMRWDVLCPNCRVVKAEHEKLAGLRPQAHCEVCNIPFDSEFDRNVEVRFTVNPGVRSAADRVFCIGGPRNTPHRRAQLLLAPRSGRRVAMDLPAQRFFLRALSGQGRLELRPSPAGEDLGPLRAAWEDGKPLEALLHFRPGAVELDLESRMGSPLWVALEEESWTDQAATAALVTSLQDFRDLFPEEVLPASGEAKVQRLAVLRVEAESASASPQPGSSAPTRGALEPLLRIMDEAVRDCQGGMVRTAGDSATAAFHSGENAAEAACLIHERWREHRLAGAPQAPDLRLRIGAHIGPALAVNRAGAWDYSGSAVEIAVRAASQCREADLVLTHPMMECARGSLWRRSCRSEPFELAGEGAQAGLPSWRVWLGSSPGP